MLLLGAQIAKLMPARALALLFAVFVGISRTQMLLDRKPKATRQLSAGAGMLGSGGLIGVLAARVGAGGGFISVPVMAWCNVPIHNAVATSAALGFPIALAGTVGYIYAGSSLHGMPYGTLGFIYVPALIAIALGSVTTARLDAGLRTA